MPNRFVTSLVRVRRYASCVLLAVKTHCARGCSSAITRRGRRSPRYWDCRRPSRFPALATTTAGYKTDIATFQSDLADDAVPASRQWQRPAIGLMVKAERRKPIHNRRSCPSVQKLCDRPGPFRRAFSVFPTVRLEKLTGCRFLELKNTKCL